MDLHLFLLFVACMMLAAGGWHMYMDAIDRSAEYFAMFCTVVGAVGAIVVLIIAFAGLAHG